VIVIAFQNQAGVDLVEILRLDNGLVVEGHGAFIIRLNPRLAPPIPIAEAHMMVESMETACFTS
jgi:hypothetical protein